MLRAAKRKAETAAAAFLRRSDPAEPPLQRLLLVDRLTIDEHLRFEPRVREEVALGSVGSFEGFDWRYLERESGLGALDRGEVQDE